MNTDRNEIEGLALDFDFGSLTAAERRAVLASLGSEEAYTCLRESLRATRQVLMDDTPLPDPSPQIRARLHVALRDRYSKPDARPSLLSQFLAMRIPAYQAAVAMAAVIVMLLLVRNDSQQPQTIVREKVVYVPTPAAASAAAIDTDEIARRVADSIREELRQERMASGIDRGGRSKRRAAEPDTTPVRMASTSDTTPLHVAGNQFVGLANLPQLASQRRGKSLSEDSAYSRFTVTMGRDTF